MLRLRSSRALLALFLLSLPAVTTRIYASDEIQYFAFLRSIWFDHDVSFDNEYQYFDDHGVARRAGFHETFLETTTPTGYRKTYATVGSAILWAPFYALGDAVARVRRLPTDGYSQPYVAAVCYASAFYGFAALMLAASVARRLACASTAAVVCVWIGTPVLFYMYLAPVFAHATGAFAVALLLWTWLAIRQRWTPGGLLVLGAVAALVAMVREQDIVLLSGPAVDFAWSILRRELRARPAVRAAVAAAAGFTVAYLPQAIAYRAINGSLRPAHDVTRKMTWTSPHALEVLFSPAHGLVWWTPLVILAAAGAAWLWKRQPRVMTCMLIMVALDIYIAGCVESWTVAGAFGQRRFMSLTPLLVVGLSALFCAVRGRTARAALWTLAVGAVWWNLGLMVQFGDNSMDRQRLSLRRNAVRTFVELPREAPALARRYLTDRSSFYHPAR